MLSDRESASQKARTIGVLALAPQPHHDIDPRDLVALGRAPAPCRRGTWVGRDVHQIILVFDEKVVVLGIIGVGIDLRAIHRDLAQQAHFGELVQEYCRRWRVTPAPWRGWPLRRAFPPSRGGRLCPNKIQPSAMRCRVGHNPTHGGLVLTSCQGHPVRSGRTGSDCRFDGRDKTRRQMNS